MNHPCVNTQIQPLLQDMVHQQQPTPMRAENPLFEPETPHSPRVSIASAPNSPATVSAPAAGDARNDAGEDLVGSSIRSLQEKEAEEKAVMASWTHDMAPATVTVSAKRKGT